MERLWEEEKICWFAYSVLGFDGLKLFLGYFLFFNSNLFILLFFIKILNRLFYFPKPELIKIELVHRATV